MWSEGIKQYYLKNSRLYDIDDVEVSGKLRVTSNKFDSRSDFDHSKVRNICWLIEIHVHPKELVPYLEILLSSSKYNLEFKLDPTKFHNSLNYFNELELYLPKHKLLSSHMPMEDAILKYDLFIGCFSTALIDSISSFKPILIIKTRQWGNYFHIDENISLIIKSEKDLLSSISYLNYQDQLLFKNIFAPESNYYGPDWIINKLKLYEKNF